MAVVVESVGTGQQSSDTTSLTITAPASIANGNLLLAAVARDPQNAGNVAITGFTRIDFDIDSADSADSFTAGRGIDLLYKIAASESGDYSATWTGNQQAVGAVLRISGHHPTSPIVMSARGYSFAQYLMVQGIEVPAATMILTGVGTDGNPTLSKDNGPASTERVNLNSSASGGMCKLLLHSYIQAAAGWTAPFVVYADVIDELFDFAVGIRDAAYSATVEKGLHGIEQGIAA